MGKVKLTLTVDENVVLNAKRLARNKQQSLSAMIEQLLTSANIAPAGHEAGTVSNALTLRGIAKGSLSRKTDKQIRDMMHRDRHGL